MDIEYCPVHAAAEPMLGALKLIVEEHGIGDPRIEKTVNGVIEGAEIKLSKEK